ncbi:MAG: phenylalanine--tRNA ligase subunit beta, partial [Oscillospiraceae bacterium]|nr:phenylalanine--tRNA ligase subunit beta [Oscillospiraceae bacterium]
MKLSLKWLKSYINKDIPVKEFCHGMTMSGSKAEGYETEGSELSGIVTGKVTAIERHPDSDHMFVCTVDAGQDTPLQIVTAAQNVSKDDYVPVALHGSAVAGGKKIKKTRFRGVESNGMLCSLAELGLTLNDFPYASEEGIFILQEESKHRADCCEDKFEIGQDIRPAIGLDGVCVEFEITSNRPDCMSVLGLAREASAAFDCDFTVTQPEPKCTADGDINELLKVTVKNTELCKRYCAGTVKNIKIEPSPKWLRERLRTSGIRPINNIVDITNYVMLEYGQPMHAFDLNTVGGGEIIIRNADIGEKITTLDGTERELTPEMLVIADTEKPMAVAGVMGGHNSGIFESTQTAVFESAYFAPVSVRKTSKALGMRTDASSRFEKGLDPAIALTALKRALELVEMLGAGDVIPGIIDKDYHNHENKTVAFDCEWINAFLGTDIPRKEMEYALAKLGFEVSGGNVRIPSFRADIEGKADISEEIARIYGYDKIPSILPSGTEAAILTDRQKAVRKLKQTLTAAGCTEIMTFSFVSPKVFAKTRLPETQCVTIRNPLGEDTSVMRTNLIPSMLETLARNYNSRNEEVCLFEIGKEY